MKGQVLAWQLGLLLLIASLEWGQAEVCKVSLPQCLRADDPCFKSRHSNLEKQRSTWVLIPPPAYPYTRVDISPSQLLPLLQGLPFQGPIAKLQFALAVVSNSTYKRYKHITAHMPPVPAIEEYAQLWAAYKPEKYLGEYVRRPDEHGYFQTDYTTWLSDEFFAEQRLAGTNPMGIQQVTLSRKRGLYWHDLKKLLNPTFDWNGALTKILQDMPCHLGSQSLNWAIKNGYVYALRLPMCDDMVTMDDLYTFPGEGFNRTMWPFKSPIALFVTVPASGVKDKESTRRLMPFAIQMDYKPVSRVFAPSDGGMWTVAKLNVQVTDFGYSQMVEHLSKIHFPAEVFCISLERHMSPLHPLYVIMKYHCRGLISTNVMGPPKLVSPHQFEHHLHAYGWKGAKTFVEKAAKDTTWDGMDFRKNLARRGVSDRRSLPYFPYRDDGLLVHKVIDEMIRDYTDVYYADDYAVKADFELQNWASEVSADGTGPFGGTGKIRGFPPQLASKAELQGVLSRIIWLMTGQHSALNYPASTYGSYIPNTPTKLYSDTRGPADGSFSMYTLEHRNTAALQVRVFQSLGRLRFDRLFDYGPSLDDAHAREVVTKHYDKLQRRVGAVIEVRNKKRYENGHLTYPYLEPRWLTNSIQN